MARSDELILKSYNTDKMASGYLSWYDELFVDRWKDVGAVLEMGIKDGGSLRLWADYFPNAKVVGLDLQPPTDWQTHDRITMFAGSQDDPLILERICKECAPDGFDLIIDDAAHLGRLSESSFNLLFAQHLKPGGVYIVEDWGTGYWPDWPDGAVYRNPSLRPSLGQRMGLLSRDRLPSHDWGMVGFVKRLIDRQGISDISKGFAINQQQPVQPTIERLVIGNGLAIAIKAKAID